MEVVFIAALFVVVVAVLVRVAVGFLRWVRAHPAEAGHWALATYVGESLGNWIDGMNDHHRGHTSDGSHHHHADGSHIHHHHEAPGMHSHDAGGHF